MNRCLSLLAFLLMCGIAPAALNVASTAASAQEAPADGGDDAGGGDTGGDDAGNDAGGGDAGGDGQAGGDTDPGAPTDVDVTSDDGDVSLNAGGEGSIDPADDLPPSTEAPNPEIMQMTGAPMPNQRTLTIETRNTPGPKAGTRAAKAVSSDGVAHSSGQDGHEWIQAWMKRKRMKAN